MCKIDTNLPLRCLVSTKLAQGDNARPHIVRPIIIRVQESYYWLRIIACTEFDTGNNVQPIIGVPP